MDAKTEQDIQLEVDPPNTNSPKSVLVRHTTDLCGENYFQGCLFSPDGLCIITNSVLDNRLRLYNTVGSKASRWFDPDLQVRLCGTIRDYAWYPTMDSNDPSSCCFLAASRDQPVQLIDAYSGHIRANYRPINNLDEMEAPTTLLFSATRNTFYCAGFRSDRVIHDFDINKPGRNSTILRMGKTRRSKDGQKGLVSAMAESPAATGGHLLAVGTYSPGSIYAYDVRTRIESDSIVPGKCLVGHGGKWLRNKPEDDKFCWISSAKKKWFQAKTQGGVTQLQFDGMEPHILYSLSRRSNAVIAWDLRMWRGIASYETPTGDTNQRIGFDADAHSGKLLIGGTNGKVCVYNTKTSAMVHQIILPEAQVSNGVSWTTVGGQDYVAISCGSRQFPSLDEMGNDENMIHVQPGRLYLYSVNYLSLSSRTDDVSTTQCDLPTVADCELGGNQLS